MCCLREVILKWGWIEPATSTLAKDLTVKVVKPLTNGPYNTFCNNYEKEKLKKGSFVC